MGKFKLKECADVSYEGMVIDICIGEERLATLDSDEGSENEGIVLFDEVHEEPIYKFDFHAFMDILQKGFERLKEVNPE